MGVLHRGSAGGPPSPERDGVALVLWCADLSCSTDCSGPTWFDISNYGQVLDRDD
jgi:hypothetical protein